MGVKYMYIVTKVKANIYFPHITFDVLFGVFLVRNPII